MVTVTVTAKFHNSSLSVMTVGMAVMGLQFH